MSDRQEVPKRFLEAIIPGFHANGPGPQSTSSHSGKDRRVRSTDETPAPHRQRLSTQPAGKDIINASFRTHNAEGLDESSIPPALITTDDSEAHSQR